MTHEAPRPPLPPFTEETAREKVRLAEDGWNSRNPAKVALAYTRDSKWRNRAEFPQGRQQIEEFLTRKWDKELDYRLIKELWAYGGNRISVRYAYEYHDDSGNWFRAYGNENWEFDENGYMAHRHASINEQPIREEDRKFHWPLGRRPDGHPGLSDFDFLTCNRLDKTMTTPIKLYRNPKSGHCHRVELMLAFLGLPYETIDLDMANGAHKAPEYLKISPFGLVPAIDDGGYALTDSNAILTYLVQTYAKGSDWMPSDAKDAAEVQRWLTVAADNIYAGPCAARLVKVFGTSHDHAAAVAKAHDLFKVMDAHLDGSEWLATDKITIADVACYSYIAHAPEGGVDLAPYPNVRVWLARIEAQPNFVGMATSPIPELA